MGRPSGVTHSTVRPDWAMSLALSVSQFFRGKWGRKQLELVWAAGRPHPLPAQVSPTPATNCDSPALMEEFGPAAGTIAHLWAVTGGSSVGQDPEEPSLPMEHPLVYVWVVQGRKGGER